MLTGQCNYLLDKVREGEWRIEKGGKGNRTERRGKRDNIYNYLGLQESWVLSYTGHV